MSWRLPVSLDTHTHQYTVCHWIWHKPHSPVPLSFKNVKGSDASDIFYMRDLWLQHFLEHVRDLGSVLASEKKATMYPDQQTAENKAHLAILSMPSAEIKSLGTAIYENCMMRKGHVSVPWFKHHKGHVLSTLHDREHFISALKNHWSILKSRLSIKHAKSETVRENFQFSSA